MPSYKTNINLRDMALYEELLRRAEALEMRAQRLALGAEGVSWPEGTAKDTARYYAKGIATLDVEVAREVREVLVEEQEAQQAPFWGTQLGRALFLLHAYPGEYVDRPVAQKVLGLKSRQRVHQLVVNGELEEDQGLMITAESIRRLFHVEGGRVPFEVR